MYYCLTFQWNATLTEHVKANVIKHQLVYNGSKILTLCFKSKLLKLNGLYFF